MTSFLPDPETPPEDTAGVSLSNERNAERNFEQNAGQQYGRPSYLDTMLQDGRVLCIVLTLIVSVIIARTLWFARETRNERLLSALYEDSQEALILTKSAYSPGLVFVAPVASSPFPSPSFSARSTSATAVNGSAHPVEPPDASAARPRSPTPAATKQHESMTDTKNTLPVSLPFRKRPSTPATRAGAHTRPPEETSVDRAIARWQALAHSKMARAAEWRRLGIVLALFHRRGSLEAFAHIGDPFPAAVDAQKRTQKHRLSLRAQFAANAQQADPFGHGPVTVNATREIAVWQMLYGSQPVPAAQVPPLRQTLLQLRLGWFENIALAQLYQKAGRRTEARQAAQAADSSAQQVRFQMQLRGYTLLYGILGGVLVGIMAFVRGAHRNENPASTEVRKQALATLFPVEPLLLAFVLYLLCHLTLSLTVRFLLQPFVPFLENWSSPALLRLEVILQLALYIPVFVIPLLAVSWRVPFDPLTGQRMRMRQLLTHLGYHTRNLFTDVGTGLGGYLLMTPVLLLGSLVSYWLFHRFHTPVNPAQFESLAAQFTLDKALVFIITAVAAPIVEETMFRGFLYTALRARLGIMGGAALSAALFAAVHPTLPGGFLPIWVIGVALALVYERRGSLLPGMILHGIHNGLIMLLGFAVFSK